MGIYLLLARAIRANDQPHMRWAGYVALLAVFLYELSDAFYLSRTGMLGMLLLYVVIKQTLKPRPA